MKILLISLIGFLLISSVSGEVYAQNAQFESNHFLSFCHLLLGKITYHQLRNHEQAEKEFKEAIRLDLKNKDAYLELSRLYYDRSLKSPTSDLQLMYLRKSVDISGKLLMIVASSPNRKDALRYAGVKGFKQALENQVSARIAPQIGPFEAQANTYSTESEPEFASGTHSLRESSAGAGGLREPLRMNSGESKGFSLTEKGDAFHREKPFTMEIGKIKGRASTRSYGGGGITPKPVTYSFSNGIGSVEINRAQSDALNKAGTPQEAMNVLTQPQRDALVKNTNNAVQAINNALQKKQG